MPPDMIRYLIVCKVNAPMIWFHLFPPMEISLVLGNVIAESLPTVQARPWHQALEAWKPYGGLSLLKKRRLKHPPVAQWPVDAVVFCYPGKRGYGKGESILFELKLMGGAADHVFFLEVILPALEKASHTIDRNWQPPDSLWGRFDIQNIYVAHGPRWDTLVDDSALDLAYTASPQQWHEGLDLAPSRSFQRLKWVTPFDLRDDGTEGSPCQYNKATTKQVPTLKDILLSFQHRMNTLQPDNPGWDLQFQGLSGKAPEISLDQAIDLATDVPITHTSLYPVLESEPGCWIGKQRFEAIPSPIIPYLALASIFHVGAHTHFGCGTFLVD